MIQRVFLVLLLVMGMACSKDKPEAPVSQQQPPVATASAPSPAAESATPTSGAFARSTGSKTLTISPATGYVNTKFSLSAEGFSLPSGMGDDRIVWYHNGGAISTAHPQSPDLGEYMIMKGDVLQAVVIIDGKEIYSNPVAIVNHPPVIVDHAFGGDVAATGGISLEVETEDIDADQVSVEYRWTMNGLPAGNRQRAELSPNQGDQIEVTATPYDGEEYGQPVTFTFGMENRAPRFESIADYYMVGSTYIYNASASDPDHESISYSLQNAPSGMMVDATSGQVTWDVPADFSGTVEYSIVATDAAGMGALLPMKFSVYLEAQ